MRAGACQIREWLLHGILEGTLEMILMCLPRSPRTVLAVVCVIDCVLWY